MDVPYGTTAFVRERGNFPTLPVINMFAEKVLTEDKPVLQSRPGLQNSGSSMGVGPVKALFQIDGVLDGSLFGISDNKLYKGTINLGTLDGTGPARLAGYESFIFANQGTSLYGYDGASFTTISTPDSFEVLSMTIGSSRLIVIDKGTGRFYWSDVLSGTISALSFATAENSPDLLKDCLYIGDTLILFGSETVEFWPITTDPTAPFQPLVGRVFSLGIRDTGCCTTFGPTYAWVTNQNQVCVTDPETIISFPGLEAHIEESASVSLWTFRLEGIEFLALRLDDETWVFNPRTNTWSEFQSSGGNWIPQCYNSGLFGSSVDGNLLEWSADYSDFGDILERRFRAGISTNSGSIRLDNVGLRTNPGQTSFLTGTYANPSVSLSLSGDGGFVWSDYEEQSLGETGQYRTKVQWLSLGMYSYPGVLMDFRVTDPVPFRVSDVFANEPYGNV